jgi:hypothetical protein
MKPLIVCTAIFGLAFTPAAAEAKGCIKGAIVGGVAGHLAGHGKVGAVAGCIIGHHEANRRRILRLRATACNRDRAAAKLPSRTPRQAIRAAPAIGFRMQRLASAARRNGLGFVHIP